MSDIRDAEPLDVYVDGHGVIWRVQSTCSEPTVTLVRLIEPGVSGSSATDYMRGGVSGAMWANFKRIYRGDHE